MNAQTVEELEQRDIQIKNVAESSKKVRFALANRENEKIRRDVLESYKIDVGDKERFDFKSPFFSFGGMREACSRVASKESSRMRETNAISTFSAVLRAGVNNFANEWYQLTKTVYEQIVAVTPSTHLIEPYAPIARGSTPRRTPPGTPFKEVKIQGPADIQILNEKFGAISSAQWELFKYDMTGQIMTRLQDIGPNMALLEEAWVFGKFISPSGGTLYQGDTIPVSGTKPSIETSSTWPWSTSMLGGGANRLSSYAVFSNNNVQALDYLLMIQRDQNGNFMAVDPDTLVMGPGVKFVGLQLLNSEWYPTTAAQLIGGGISGTTIGSTGTSTTATNVGTTFAQNQMKGLYKPVVSRFLPPGAYGLMQAHRGMVFQMAEGLSVIQEFPASGASFESDEIRWRSKSAWMTEWIEPRFAALGNDGSAQ